MEERLEKIFELIELESNVSIADLAKRFNVSEVTIYRDLNKLEKMGKVNRILRGASVNKKETFRKSYSERMKKNINEKIAIAKKAISYISTDETIAICGGTTTYQLAKLLGNSKLKVRVLTNSIDSAIELMHSDSIDVIIPAGKITEWYTIKIIEDQCIFDNKGIIDKIFVGGDGVDLNHGLTGFSEVGIEASYILAKNARQIIVLVDHSKFNIIRYTKLIPIDKISILISDNGLSNKIVKEYREKGINLVLA